MEVTITEEITKKGKVIVHNPPIKIQEQRLYIVRDDGVMFGDGADEPLEELELKVQLREMPDMNKLWSISGVKAYKQGLRPDAKKTFNRVVNVVNRFIDFNSSFADQKTMSELVGCYILATWFWMPSM